MWAVSSQCYPEKVPSVFSHAEGMKCPKPHEATDTHDLCSARSLFSLSLPIDKADLLARLRRGINTFVSLGRHKFMELCYT